MSEPVDRVEAETDESLPPLPDGGLATSMPDWLRRAPAVPFSSRLSDRVDLASLTAHLELPEWLGDLSRRVGERPSPPAPLPLRQERGDEPSPPAPLPLRERGDDSVPSPEAGEGGAERRVRASDVDPPLQFRVRSGQEVRAENDGRTLGPPMRETAIPVQTPEKATEPPRSTIASVVLLLLLMALVAIGVWYYL